MSKLYFKVASDWQEVVRLRNEIAKLEAQIKSMDANKAPQAVAVLNHQMQQTKQQMQGMITEAAKAGAVMENDFKSKIYQSSQSVNDFTQKIINQKAVVKDVEADVKRLGESYRSALKNNPLSASGKLSEYTSAKKTLDEEKAALFGLTQEQANALLSVKKLRDEYAQFRDDSKQTVSATDGIGFSLKKAFAVIGGAALGKEFLSNMVRVRGEFQAADTAIQTLLGSKEKADALMSQVKDFAKISPLEFSDVTAATQMMLGFNVEAEKVPRYLQAIGDVSMGNTQKFNSLTLAFSQMSAAGKLMGQDLNQMINAGFNPLSFMSEKTGKSFSVLKDEMSKGAISAEMVQQAFVDATSAGGKFYQMSENASKTINGQLSMMHDAMDAALNELGTKSEGIIMGGIQMTTKLVENYETIGKVLAGLVATYGAYRTAVMLTTIATGKHTIAEVALTNVRVLARKAQLALNASMLTNPYVALATTVVALGAAMWALHDSTSAAEKAQKKYNDERDRFKEGEEQRKQKVEELIRVIQDETETQFAKIKAYEELQKYSPKLTDAYTREQLATLELAKSQKVLNDERDKMSYESLISNIDKYSKYVKELNAMPGGWSSSTKGTSYLQREFPNTSVNEAKKQAEADLSEYRRQLEEYKRLKKETEDNSKPVEIRLMEAKSSREQIIQEYNAARITLEEEQRKIKESGFGVIPIDVQIRFDNARKALSNMDQAIKELASVGRTITYKDAYDKAKKEWEDAKKSLSNIEKDKSKFTTKQYEDAKKRSETSEKAYKDLGGITGSLLTKQESAAEKLRKEQEKSAEDLLSLRRQNQQDEVNLMKEGSDKKLKQIELDYQKELDVIKKQEKEWSKAQKGKLTQEQTIEISTRYTNAENNKEKSIGDNTKERLIADQQALNEYLTKYGTFQQQKLAIAQEYAEKIKKTQEESGINSTQVKLLQREQHEKTSAIDIASIKANIDWVAVFGEFGGMFSDMIKPALEDAKKYIKTDEFKNSDQSDQKALIDAINQMEKSFGGSGGLNFKKLGQDVQIYQNSLRDLNAAKEEEIDAINKLKNAQEDYEKAIKGGTEQEKQAAKDALDSAQMNADTASTNVKTQTDIVNQIQQGLSDTAINLKANMDNVSEGLSKLASGGIKSAYDGLIQAGKGMGGSMEKIAKSLEDVPIIGWIVSIIDVLKDGLSNLVGGILDAVFNAVGGIISDVLSGDLFVTIGKSIISGVGNILNAISFGGFNSLFGIGGNKKEVEEAINRLTDRNETLQTAIEDLTDVMEASKGTKSVAAYADAKKLQKETEDNYKKIAQEQARYSSAHHSWNYYWNGFNQDEVSRLSGQIGRNWNGDIWSLSPEEMKMLRSNVDMWEKIQNAGKGDYGGRLADKLNDYIDQAGKMEELTDKLYEGLTGISFDGMYDSFIDTLMDMKYDAQAAAEDISEYFMRAMLSNKIGELYSDKLEEWWKKFGASMEDNELSEAEREVLQDEYMGYVKEAMKLRDELAAATGYDKISQDSTSQSSTKKGYEAMSQDTGEELNGRFTALQIAGEEIKNQSVIQTQQLSLLTMKSEDIFRVNSEIRNIADETRDLIANSYLELVQISENTGAIIKPIKDMAADIKEVKKNTSKL